MSARGNGEGRFRSSDGISIHYVIDDFTAPWKTPDTLVLLHAAMGTLHRFYAWVPRLAARYRVVRPDMRGHGESEVPSGQTLSIERLKQDLVELLDHLGIESAHLVGSSSGGIIAMLAAIENPQRVKTLASFAAIPGLKPSTGHNDYDEWLRRLGEDGMAGFLKRTISQRFDVDAVEPGFIDWFCADAARNDPKFLARFVTMMTSFDFSDRLSQIRCPALYVVPSGDPVHSMENYEVLKSTPDNSFIVYENMPHNITDAVPDRCLDDLEAFLNARAGR